MYLVTITDVITLDVVAVTFKWTNAIMSDWLNIFYREKERFTRQYFLKCFQTLCFFLLKISHYIDCS